MPFNSAIVPSFRAQISFNAPSLAANTTTDVNIPAPGCLRDYFYIVTAPTLNAGLVISHAWCNTAGTLTLRIGNLTAAPIDPAALNFHILGL